MVVFLVDVRSLDRVSTRFHGGAAADHRTIAYDVGALEAESAVGGLGADAVIVLGWDAAVDGTAERGSGEQHGVCREIVGVRYGIGARRGGGGGWWW